MRKKAFPFPLVSVFLLAGMAGAQQQPGNVSLVYWVKPKAGMRQQFEQAAKKHAEVIHRQLKDPRTWDGFDIVAGERTGWVVWGLPGQRWADFDTHAKLHQADVADWDTTVMQFLETGKVEFSLYHPEISRPMAGETPPPLGEILWHHLNIGGEPEYLHALRRTHEAIQKTNWPVYYDIYELYDGGEHPTYALVFPHKNWADFLPPETSFRAMLEKALGPEEAEALTKIFDKTVHCVRSEVAAYRADLSYIPAAK